MAHLPEQPFNRDGFPLCVLGAGQGDFLQQLLVLQFLQHLQQVQHLVVGHQEGEVNEVNLKPVNPFAKMPHYAVGSGHPDQGVDPPVIG